MGKVLEKSFDEPGVWVPAEVMESSRRIHRDHSQSVFSFFSALFSAFPHFESLSAFLEPFDDDEAETQEAVANCWLHLRPSLESKQLKNRFESCPRSAVQSLPHLDSLPLHCRSLGCNQRPAHRHCKCPSLLGTVLNGNDIQAIHMLSYLHNVGLR